jgi:flavin reductase (DIM6/NTAB) family NADH-FMN oxidoreductase RutF
MDGAPNVAPKHMATPLGWQNHYAFVCSPDHVTYQNITAGRQFTVSFPRPEQLVQVSLAAAPRWTDDTKPSLQALDLSPARVVSGVLVKGCYLHIECEVERIVDGFGTNSLIAGRIVAAQAAEDALRTFERDDNDIFRVAPLLAYVAPGRFALIDRTNAFPFPEGFSR